ncbi:helix-turn-helix domain-containing protein [Rheinheimera aquimaris]|uniref:helix-turn-helix domain-containing protein n=1 Tax=Rheinheimera aquimaris TaxID=412437 RepID=UPI001E3F00A6|nr:helix-turn-helix transcriptional regulator [Rheinheimera aquimaris]MCD1597895.1 helix-turn-helix transcriptional regulator [Rheinheimera aquimaris]
MQWLELLRQKCEELGRRKVEADLGISKTTLSQILNEKYPGSLANMAAKVTDAYSSDKVQCPVLGSITVQRCATEQSKPFAATNPQRVKLWKACQSCPLNKANKP